MKFFRFLLLVLVLLAVAGFVLLRVPFGPQTETFVDIPQGSGTSGIATRLEKAGIIRSRYAFDLYRKLHGGTLKAGEYRFDHKAPLSEVYTRIAQGDVSTIALTIPEGFNVYDIAQAVQAAGLGNAQDFLRAEQLDTVLIADLSPHAPSLEGYLFPDTYAFNRHATPHQMLAAMVKRFRREAVTLGLLAPAGAVGDKSLYDVARTVTMASLVEKEVRNASERPLVAGVFENRLKLGMPLATDPAVAYAALLDGRWRGTIYQSDLQSDSAYNTYKHAGLPPGPIANPGVAALKAAMQPARTDFLYFVADANGNTRFSVDLKEHAAQVQAYRAAGGR